MVTMWVKGDNSMSNVSFSVRKPRTLILMPIIVGIIEGLFFCALIVLMLIYPNDTADKELAAFIIKGGMMKRPYLAIPLCTLKRRNYLIMR